MDDAAVANLEDGAAVLDPFVRRFRTGDFFTRWA